MNTAATNRETALALWQGWTELWNGNLPQAEQILAADFAVNAAIIGAAMQQMLAIFPDMSLRVTSLNLCYAKSENSCRHLGRFANNRSAPRTQNRMICARSRQ